MIKRTSKRWIFPDRSVQFVGNNARVTTECYEIGIRKSIGGESIASAEAERLVELISRTCSRVLSGCSHLRGALLTCSSRSSEILVSWRYRRLYNREKNLATTTTGLSRLWRAATENLGDGVHALRECVYR